MELSPPGSERITRKWKIDKESIFGRKVRMKESRSPRKAGADQPIHIGLTAPAFLSCLDFTKIYIRFKQFLSHWI